MKKILLWIINKLQSIIDNTEDLTNPEEIIDELKKTTNKS